MKSYPRVLCIAFDAAEPTLLRQWAESGELPAWKQLFDDSCSGPIHNSPGFFAGSVWPSCFTGVNPARHGRYCYRQVRPGGYDQISFHPDDLGFDPIWKTLSEADKRVALLDLPKSPLLPDVNGVHIRDWGTHDPYHDVGPISAPADLIDKVVKRHGLEPAGPAEAVERTGPAITDYIDRLCQRARTRGDICDELLQREAWDLFFVALTEAHCIGHGFWDLHDENHASHDAELRAAVGRDPVLAIYKALDRQLARLLKWKGPETSVVVFSSCGMAPQYTGSHLLDDVLARVDARNGGRARRTSVNVAKWCWERTPQPVRGSLQPIMNAARTRRRSRTGRTNVSLAEVLSVPPIASRRFFAVPNNNVYGAVRLNVIGRDANGQIAPGRDYDRICAMLCDALLDLTNDDTGNPAITRVYRTDQNYSGEFVGNLPDLTVEWAREAPITRVSSPKVGQIVKPFPGRLTGDHVAEGLFTLSTPDNRPVAPEAAIEDVAATLAHLLGVSAPGLDGRSLC